MRDPAIHQAHVADARRIGRITSEAFFDDPVNLWIMRKPLLIKAFMTGLAKNIYLPRGFSEYLDEGAGATMWLPPGADGDLSLGNTLALGASAVLHGVPSALARGMAFGACVQKVHPKEPHFYLFTIGIVPRAQGKGLGGALLRSGLARVDQAGMPAYLESTKASNIPIYERYGFELRDVPTLPEGCPPIYPMWRPAQPATV